MANSYFLNAQCGSISVQLNSGLKYPLAALNAQPPDNPYYSLGLAASQDKDVLGTSSVNILSVTTSGQANSINWTIAMKGIAPNEDIQFLVFEKHLLARQGNRVEGFTITGSS